jgi:hypothetical protein
MAGALREGCPREFVAGDRRRRIRELRRAHVPRVCNLVATRHRFCTTRCWMAPVSYVLPYRSTRPPSDDFVRYVNRLSERVDLLVVDASPESIRRQLEKRCGPGVRIMPPDPEWQHLRNGKVRGVLTGLRHALHDDVIIADDDVRYSEGNLTMIAVELGGAAVVRPQNYFAPLPWHALLDTARMLIARVTGGDWPGTLAVKRAVVMRAGGYDGNVLFENLELVRTVEAAGGRAIVRRELLIERRPPTTRHFWTQRVRQAYDEFARPVRLVAALAILPVSTALVAMKRWGLLLAVLVIVPMALAEWGRRVGMGRQVFPAAASLCAPLWVVERAVCAWVAVLARLVLGGVPYHGQILAKAANSPRTLHRRVMEASPPASERHS